MNDNEKATLKLPPKFTIFENIDKKKCVVEIETMVTKYMWDMRNRNGDEEEENGTNAPNEENEINTNNEENTVVKVPIPNPTLTQTQEERMNTSREEIGSDTRDDENTLVKVPIPNPILTQTQHPHPQTRTSGLPALSRNERSEYHYDIDKNEFDFRKLRPTDLPFNKQMFMPQNNNSREIVEEEIQLAFLSRELEKATEVFVSQHEMKLNITEQEQKGLKSLMKRNDAVVFQTDKSSRFSIDTRNNYIAACEKHTDKDEVISEHDYQSLINEVNAHSVMWSKILKAGEKTGDYGTQRIKENLLSAEKCDAPPLYALRKDHKTYEDETIGPPTRPVCGAAAAHNGKLSHLLSMILKEVKRLDNASCESTEDILAEINDVNENVELRENESMIVGSLDVKALYPSLDIKFTAKKVADEFCNSPVNIDNESIDVEELGLYLALNVEEDELYRLDFKKYCPTRVSKRGRKPNMTGQANCSRDKRNKVWNQAEDDSPGNGMVKRMLGKALEIGINQVMSAHVYKFNGEIRKQMNGGAIGLEMTGEIAGVFMMWWDRQLRERLVEEGMNVCLYKRYVDDINIVVKTSNQECDRNVIERIKEIGDQIHTSIKLEADYPSNHVDGKVPILDLKVWISENKVLHEYYSKDVSSKSVISNKSAMPLRDKRTVLTQEILRIILRCSPSLPWEIVKGHVEDYMMRLQFSGYSVQFREQILRSALKAHSRIKEKVARGERPLYRRKDWKQKERLKEKRGKKENWYKKKKDYRSVLFVQPTEGSALKKVYEDVISKSRCRVKVVERAGTSIKKMLQKSYPFEKAKCEDKCFVCMSEGSGNCRRCNVSYEIVCTREGCKNVYIGETSRNAFCRGKEHLKDLETMKEESVLVEHLNKCHEGDTSHPPCHQFKMNITDNHSTTLNRLVNEAVSIETKQNLAPGRVLNRKHGFRVNSVLKLSTTLNADAQRHLNGNND